MGDDWFCKLCSYYDDADVYVQATARRIRPLCCPVKIRVVAVCRRRKVGLLFLLPKTAVLIF